MSDDAGRDADYTTIQVREGREPLTLRAAPPEEHRKRKRDAERQGRYQAPKSQPRRQTREGRRQREKGKEEREERAHEAAQARKKRSAQLGQT